jgi:hypothetical protein
VVNGKGDGRMRAWPNLMCYAGTHFEGPRYPRNTLVIIIGVRAMI